MDNHFNLSDTQFETQFRDCTLPVSLFSHEAHLRLAWIHINKYGLINATKNICKQLTNYVIKTGALDKYNATVTVASVKMINHFMGKSKSDSFQNFILEFPELKLNFKGLISNHYSSDIFNLEKAKANYLEPDLLGFYNIK